MYGENTLDPAAVEWWGAYLNKPRVSKFLLWSNVLLPLFVWVVAAAHADPSANASGVALMTFGVMTGVTLAKLFILDWGSFLTREKLAHIPQGYLIAPFPIAAALSLIASALDTRLFTGASLLLASLCTLFAWFTRLDRQAQEGTNIWALIGYLNIPMAVWLGIIAFHLSTELGLLFALVALSHVISQPRLDAFWFGTLTEATRSRMITVLLIACAFSIGIWLYTQASPKVMVAASIILVLLHRVAVQSLSEQQHQVRVYAMYAAAFVTLVVLETSHRDDGAPVALSVFFLLGSVLGLLMALRNSIISTRR